MIVAATNFPLQLDAAGEFAVAREFFRQAGFDDRTLCRVLEMESMGDLGRVAWEKVQPDLFRMDLRWCIQVFVRGLPAGQAESRTACGPRVFDALAKLGLIRPARKDPAAVVCPVWVYPADGFVIASDRRDDPDGEPYTPAADVVFPAIYGGTLRFLQLLPDVRDGEALDLCGGTGIGALRLSRTARVAVTADVAERCALFATFNARLNGVSIESVCGDVYEPVRDRKFSVISAHPPFVPATGPRMVYRDGGETGEDVTRRIIEGLPAHLRPGGTCVIVCVACDAGERTFEQRVTEWLGERSGEFDVVFGLEKVLPVEEVVDSIRKRGRQISADEAEALTTRLRSLGTRQFVYGALFIRRFTGRVAGPPGRMHLTRDGTAADFERWLAWREHARRQDFEEWLAESHPRLAPQLQLTARHVVHDGELSPAEFVFSVERGFQAALRPDGWIVPLVARLEGARSVREVFQAAQGQNELPEGFGLEPFLDLVRRMIERGFLEVDFPR